tara:strand:+ start:1124 stop:2170 length:1047 start_codon:yes stop_codon:yes gene_type:complete
MPYKSGELKGELTTPEIRKLIKAHNVLMSIKIPKGATRNDILKILDDKGYMVNHVRQSIQRRYKNERKPNVTLKQAEKITAPKKKTELQKQKIQEAKEAKEEKKKKDERAIRKKAVEEEKKRAAKKAPKPTSKKVSVGVGTEKAKKEDKTEKAKKQVPFIISKIKDSNAKLYDYNFKQEKDIVEWFNNWKRDRRTLTRELKKALSKGVVTKEDLKPIEPINISRTKKYKIREGQIFRAIKEQQETKKEDKTEKAKKEDKKEIITVFKDIAMGFKEILEEAEPEDRNNREIKSIKIVIDKLNKGSMSFTETQKKIIKRAIDAYLDMDFAGDPELQREVSIAKKLQAKYK